MPEVLLHTANSKDCRGLLSSKYIKKYKVVRDCNEGLEYLKAISTDDGDKRVIICTSDDASSIVDQNRNYLIDYFSIPCCEHQGEITRLMNKKTMGDYASHNGLMVPWNTVVENRVIPKGVVFPCITKPILSIDGCKDDIRICSNRHELEELINGTKCLKIQVQQFIEKEFEYQLIGCSLDGGHTIIIPGRARIITQPICTNTGFLKYEHLDGNEPIEKCHRFLENIKYSGLFSMEFIRGKDGKDYFLEINFRNDGNSISVTEAGVNLSYIWFAHCRNLDWQGKKRYDLREIYVMPEYTEVGLWYIGEISFTRMIREFRKADVFMDFSNDDPKPTNGRYDLIVCFCKCLIKKPLRNLLVSLKIKK